MMPTIPNSDAIAWEIPSAATSSEKTRFAANFSGSNGAPVVSDAPAFVEV